MALFTEQDIRARARDYRNASSFRASQADAVLLRESVSKSVDHFDVFLSHSSRDAELILGVVQLLTRAGLSVYVDWIVDTQLDRSSVNVATAEALRNRMRQSRSLVYVSTALATNSKWMPWELGYFDGLRSAVAILPIVPAGQSTFQGQEYLGLYPWIDGSSVSLWVNRGAAPSRLYRGASNYEDFSDWLRER